MALVVLTFFLAKPDPRQTMLFQIHLNSAFPSAQLLRCQVGLGRAEQAKEDLEEAAAVAAVGDG